MSQMTALKEIIEKYRENIFSLMEEISNERQHWEADMQAIIQNYLPEEVKNRPKDHKKRYRGFGLKRRLLFDFMMMKPDQNDNQATWLTSEVFPNPGFNQQNLVYQVDKAGKVNIQLIDAKGNVVKQLVQEHQSTGEHQIKLNTESLSEGVYYYVIEQGGNRETKQVLIQK